LPIPVPQVAQDRITPIAIERTNERSRRQTIEDIPGIADQGSGLVRTYSRQGLRPRKSAAYLLLVTFIDGITEEQ
jgi:hypothetical protein